jgi:hypothetical protein
MDHDPIHGTLNRFLPVRIRVNDRLEIIKKSVKRSMATSWAKVTGIIPEDIIFAAHDGTKNRRFSYAWL